MNELKYFDNAATTYPKPPAVVAAVVDAIKYKGGNPGRGSHALSEAAAELVYDTRETAARFFDAEPENIVFTENATHALNYAIKGLARRGYTILIDNYAHNASYRPCVALSDKGFCTLRVYDASGNDGETLGNIKKLKSAVIAMVKGIVCRKKVSPVRIKLHRGFRMFVLSRSALFTGDTYNQR